MTGAEIPLPVPGTPEPAEAPLSWTYNPWHDRPAAAVLAALLALGLCIVMVGSRQSWLLTVALSVAAIASLSPALAPLRCELDADGVARRGPLGWQRRAWREIRSATLRRGGLLVSPYRARHPLESYRGLFLPWSARAAGELRPLIQPRLDRHGL